MFENIMAKPPALTTTSVAIVAQRKIFCVFDSVR
jgi:hypothetical protein